LVHKDRIYAFDVLNPAFRAWWTKTVAQGVRETGADGLFVDQMHGNAWYHPGKRAEVAAAQAEMMRMAKEAIGAKKILLLAFLIGAQEFSYFQYGWGWRLETGPLVTYPALTQQIGEPLGEHTPLEPDGWRFTRDFEHVRVTVDLEQRTGLLDWNPAQRTAQPFRP
jgi:hypothetical protein